MAGIFHVNGFFCDRNFSCDRICFLWKEFFLAIGIIPVTGIFLMIYFFQWQEFFPVTDMFPLTSFFGGNSSCDTIFVLWQEFSLWQELSQVQGIFLWTELFLLLECFQSQEIFTEDLFLSQELISCESKFFYVQKMLYCGRRESMLPGNWCATEIFKQNYLPLTFLSKCVILSSADFHWNFLWPIHDFLETMSPRLRQIKRPESKLYRKTRNIYFPELCLYLSICLVFN